MQFDTGLPGPDFLDAVAEAELHNGNEVNAAVWRGRAKQWREDLATRDQCHGCYPAIFQNLAEAKARLAILDAKLASASAALR